MTELVYKTHGDPLDYGNGLHILTFAEQGFAPLDIHGRRLGVAKDILIAFADTVNHANEVGSLYPLAPISAVPRSCIREESDPAPVLRHLMDFMDANAGRIRASHLLLDFSTPRLPRHVQVAITAVLSETRPSLIAKVIVIRN